MKTMILIFTIMFLSLSIPLWAVDLQDATLKQLITERPDLVEDIKAGKDEGTVTIFVVKDAKGRMSVWTEERKNLDDVVISKRVDKYTYYLAGEINEIVQEKYKGKNLTSKQKVKHYRDGAPPDVTPMNIEIPVGP